MVITGGLGPTSDDITRDAAAEAFGRKLIFHPEILEGIAAKFAARNMVLNDLQKAQAMVPEGGVVLRNEFGTAPGLIVENDKTVAVLLPGPPRELRPMWENEALPWLKKRLAGRLPPLHEKTLRILGLGESRVQLLLEEKVRALGEVEIGYCARPGEVDLRLMGRDEKRVRRAVDLARSLLGDSVYAENRETMEEAVIRLATAAGKTVATAESCTGGLVAHRLTNVPGSSAVFRYGWITYADEAKMKELGVPADLLKKHGAVSDEVARVMAEGALQASGADVAVAVTGIAGPGGGSAEKPVGLVCFGLAARGSATKTIRETLSCDRETFKYMASQIALDLLRRALVGG
jgi:nicotinamide-nucleotide amidase